MTRPGVSRRSRATSPHHPDRRRRDGRRQSGHRLVRAQREHAGRRADQRGDAPAGARRDPHHGLHRQPRGPAPGGRARPDPRRLHVRGHVPARQPRLLRTVPHRDRARRRAARRRHPAVHQRAGGGRPPPAHPGRLAAARRRRRLPAPRAARAPRRAAAPARHQLPVRLHRQARQRRRPAALRGRRLRGRHRAADRPAGGPRPPAHRLCGHARHGPAHARSRRGVPRRDEVARPDHAVRRAGGRRRHRRRDRRPALHRRRRGPGEPPGGARRRARAPRPARARRRVGAAPRAAPSPAPRRPAVVRLLRATRGDGRPRAVPPLPPGVRRRPTPRARA